MPKKIPTIEEDFETLRVELDSTYTNTTKAEQALERIKEAVLIRGADHAKKVAGEESQMEMGLMLIVGWMSAKGPQRRRMISVDMSCELPNPALTQAEMQPVAYAAKMAMAKVLRNRKK